MSAMDPMGLVLFRREIVQLCFNAPNVGAKLANVLGEWGGRMMFPRVWCMIRWTYRTSWAIFMT